MSRKRWLIRRPPPRASRELEAEIHILQALEEQAKEVVHSGQDRKWDELSKLLQNTPEMHEASGRQRKLIIFSEHRDTLQLSGTAD